MRNYRIGAKVKLAFGTFIWGHYTDLQDKVAEVIAAENPDGFDRITVRFEDGSCPFSLIDQDLFIPCSVPDSGSP
ncbi:hypothetical protein KX729_06460 [Rhizobium sp. XQZ8]|uniref:hypothetical protein n=1 Tax=Rhizobium populisoli TaxID=2859785 RepID=UPI001CA57B27|nr:hypothetical protein [Rhizobium populisoli]MBW6421079.1 hypothetical protein [Rhizobium populisoli]